MTLAWTGSAANRISSGRNSVLLNRTGHGSGKLRISYDTTTGRALHLDHISGMPDVPITILTRVERLWPIARFVNFIIVIGLTGIEATEAQNECSASR